MNCTVLLLRWDVRWRNKLWPNQANSENCEGVLELGGGFLWIKKLYMKSSINKSLKFKWQIPALKSQAFLVKREENGTQSEWNISRNLPFLRDFINLRQGPFSTI